jgi:hypothetical protein
MPILLLARQEQQLNGIGVSVFVPAAADSLCIPACSIVVPR